MTENERELLREREDHPLGERTPWESSRQATYEDTVSRDQDDDPNEAS
ncbi:MAG: hypothetical protein M3O02_10635 [Acidobacteriota bacterium]|nr:hypothetical protein [Acidobacteriota bacterium]